jgi:glyoxylate/hydroxypyruvate reductase A
MTLQVLYAGSPARWDDYAAPLAAALARRGLDAQLAPDLDPARVEYIVYAPNGPVTDFAVFPRARAVLSLWAGVEKVVQNPTLTQPLCRMVDTGLEESMVEYVTGHVLRYHLGMDWHILNRRGEWRYRVPPLARDRTVAMLGLGELGGACARALVALNFRVLGWSRRPKALAGVECLAGEDGLDRVLAQAEIVVLLLPATPATENLLDARRLALLPKGARIVNPGRGTLIDDDALLAAVDRGHVGGATLDVFRVEPLPPGHPFWSRPAITVTPHIASETRPETACETIAENIRRAEAGEPLLYLVDRAAGY